MDIEFHYYMTYITALRAGFGGEEACKIAYSSQYTDDNDCAYRIFGEDGTYENLITQTSDITRPQEERLSIYPIFHFCPGTLSETSQASHRTDNRRHPLNTVPDNDNSRRMLSDAVGSGNLYRIGIAAHTYADTFCHYDFAGCKDDFNWLRIEGLAGGLLDDILPCIGHALALHHPDIPILVWEDSRLASQGSEKRNKTQILSAAGHLFDCFCTMTRLSRAKSIKKKLIGDISEAVGEEAISDSGPRAKTRIENYKALLGTDYREYDDAKWFDEAVRQEIDPDAIGKAEIKYNYSWKEDFRISHWYSFQEAAKAHRAKALRVLGENFGAMRMDSAGDW